MAMVRKFLVFLLAVASYLVNCQEEKLLSLELLSPKGFNVFHAKDPDIQSLSFYGAINGVKGDGRYNGPYEIYGEFNRRLDGTWVYRNTNDSLNPGDTLSFYVRKTTSNSIQETDREFYIPADAPRVPM